MLGSAVVKADSQPFSEQLADSAFADQKPAGGILQGDFFREIVLLAWLFVWRFMHVHSVDAGYPRNLNWLM